jgi:hypothetical protein
MVKFVGDLSKADAKVLVKYGKWAQHILEFGMGGSTQIFAQSMPVDPICKLWSMDTDPQWIARTKLNLDLLGIPEGRYRLMDYDLSLEGCDGNMFDLIFDDGIDMERFNFGLCVFKRLKIGGWFLMHDTRRRGDLRNFLDLVLAYKDEIGQVAINMGGSNISGFQRKVPEPYVNWDKEEGKEPWQYGGEAPPDNWPELVKEV